MALIAAVIEQGSAFMLRPLFWPLKKHEHTCINGANP